MIRSIQILTLFALSLISSSVFGQIDVSYAKVTPISGVTVPTIVDGILFGGEDSVPVTSKGAIVRTKTRMKFTELEVTRNDEEIDPKLLKENVIEVVAATETDPAVKVTTTSWLLVGEGTYKIVARGYDPVLGMAKQRKTIVLGDPAPKPPGPKPDDPPAPQPVKSFRVIFVKESGQTLPAEQTAISNAKAIRDYLGSKTTAEGGLPGYREYDPQQNITNEQPTMKALWAAAKSSVTTVPCIVIEVNGKASVIPYPKNTADALKVLKGLGGELWLVSTKALSQLSRRICQQPIFRTQAECNLV